MKYRDAKNLKEGDFVTRKSDGAECAVQSIEVYGQHKTVKIICIAPGECGMPYTHLFNDEVE